MSLFLNFFVFLNQFYFCGFKFAHFPNSTTAHIFFSKPTSGTTIMTSSQQLFFRSDLEMMDLVCDDVTTAEETLFMLGPSDTSEEEDKKKKDSSKS